MKEKIVSSRSRGHMGLASPLYEVQVGRIKKILNESIFKLGVLKAFPMLLKNNGEILRKFLNKTEADLILLVCQEGRISKETLRNRPDLKAIVDMLDRINALCGPKKKKVLLSVDNYEMHVAYAVDILFKTKPLIEFMQTMKVEDPDPFFTAILDSLLKLREIADYRLSITVTEELKRENDLKSSYRTLMMFSKNIEQLKEQLDKQRQELNAEHDRKNDILEDINKKLKKLKEKAKIDINHIVYESETNMMKDYNKSIERQQELVEEANEATKNFQSLLESHLELEKNLRSKRFKVETQLASWVAKYDQDIGEKQAEYEKLEENYNTEKEEYEALMEQFEEQEDEYVVLMAEKEAEETRIFEEKAWIFLQNRAARRIQKCWREYRERKLARKKARKHGKKTKGNKKAKKATKEKKKEEQTSLKGGLDPNALLQSKFDSELLSDIKQEDAFTQQDVVVDLTN